MWHFPSSMRSKQSTSQRSELRSPVEAHGARRVVGNQRMYKNVLEQQHTIRWHFAFHISAPNQPGRRASQPNHGRCRDHNNAAAAALQTSFANLLSNRHQQDTVLLHPSWNKGGFYATNRLFEGSAESLTQ